MTRPSPRHAPGLLLGLTLAACTASPASPSSLTYGLTLAPTGIDPHLNASAELGIPLTSVYDTLVVQDPSTGEVLPGLAARWEISDDGRRYRFHLREGVRFHDGTNFDAAAVVANLAYVTDPDHHSQKAIFLLGPFDRAETVDRLTVDLILREPFSPLLDSLAQVYLGMASPAALDRWGPAEYSFHQVGTGPYRFVEYVPNDHLTLERNPDYAWAPAIYREARASFERITFRFYEDPATRSLALESGEVDVLGEVPPLDAARLDSLPGFSLHPVPIPGQPTQFLFHQANPPTDDRRVREALVAAVDRDTIARTVYGPASPIAEAALSRGLLPGGFDHTFPGYDPARAAALLDEAGWSTGPDGIRHRDGTPLALTVVTPTWGGHVDVAQLLEAAWERMGAEVTIEVAPGFGLLREAHDRGGYHLIGINFFGTDPDLLRPMFTSDGLYNWMGLNDPLLDRLLIEAATRDLPSSERGLLYQQALSRIRDQVLLLPLRDYVNLVVASDRVAGISFSYQGWFPLLHDFRPAP